MDTDSYLLAFLNLPFSREGSEAIEMEFSESPGDQAVNFEAALKNILGTYSNGLDKLLHIAVVKAADESFYLIIQPSFDKLEDAAKYFSSSRELMDYVAERLEIIGEHAGEIIAVSILADGSRVLF